MLIKYRSWKIISVLFFFILLLAFFLRITNLNSMPIFGDEAIYLRWAQVMRAEPTLRFLPLSDGKQPLFMWLVIPLFKIVNDPLVAGRLVSIFSGLGSLVGIFFLSLVLTKSNRIALIASFIYSVSPYSIFFDRLALVDSTLTLFITWATVFAVITVKKIRLDTSMLSGFALGGALLSKSPASIYAILLPLNLILFAWPRKLKKTFYKLSIFVFLFSFTYAIAFGLYNVLRLGPNFQMISIRNKDYIFPIVHLFQNPLDPLIPHLRDIFSYFRLMGPGIILIFVTIGIIEGMRKRTKETLILLCFSLIPIFIVSEFGKVMTARYIFFSLPFIFIISAFSFLDNGFKAFKYMLLFLFLFGIFSIYVDVKLITNPQSVNLPRSERSGYLEEWTSGYGIKETAQFLKNEYLNDTKSKIVIGTEGFFGTLPDGLQVYLNDIPEITIFGVGQPINDIPQSLIDSKKVGNKTYLLINSTRYLGDPNKQGLKLISSFEKAQKPDGTREKLLLFQL